MSAHAEIQRRADCFDDLLAALIAIRDGGPRGGDDFAEWHDSYAPAIELARAAIAKATP